MTSREGTADFDNVLSVSVGNGEHAQLIVLQNILCPAKKKVVQGRGMLDSEFSEMVLGVVAQSAAASDFVDCYQLLASCTLNSEHWFTTSFLQPLP